MRQLIDSPALLRKDFDKKDKLSWLEEHQADDDDVVSFDEALFTVLTTLNDVFKLEMSSNTIERAKAALRSLAQPHSVYQLDSSYPVEEANSWTTVLPNVEAHEAKSFLDKFLLARKLTRKWVRSQLLKTWDEHWRGSTQHLTVEEVKRRLGGQGPEYELRSLHPGSNGDAVNRSRWDGVTEIVDEDYDSSDSESHVVSMDRLVDPIMASVPNGSRDALLRISVPDEAPLNDAQPINQDKSYQTMRHHLMETWLAATDTDHGDQFCHPCAAHVSEVPKLLEFTSAFRMERHFGGAKAYITGALDHCSSTLIGVLQLTTGFSVTFASRLIQSPGRRHILEKVTPTDHSCCVI